MTLEEALAQQPAWVGYWLKWMMVGSFFLPLALLIWKPSRMAGIASLVAAILSAIGVTLLFNALGYVKLLGLPHILILTPLAIYLFTQTKRADMPSIPRWIIVIVLATTLISLVFDYTDVIRYLLGERTPPSGTGPN